MNYRNIILVLIGLIIFIHLTNSIIQLMTKDGGGAILTSTPKAKGMIASKEKPQGHIEPKFKGKKRHTLVPDDPTKYGIISVNEAQMPRTQLQWDLFMEKAVIQSKTLEIPRAKEAVELMKKNPEDFAKRELEIEERITLFEKTLATNPTDEELNQRLQTLYMLKSLGKVLKNKVVATDITPQTSNPEITPTPPNF